MAKRDPKAERLKRDGVLNRHPEAVQAPWFVGQRFFDARDLVQVKYEMLRHVRIPTMGRNPLRWEPISLCATWQPEQRASAKTSNAKRVKRNSLWPARAAGALRHRWRASDRWQP